MKKSLQVRLQSIQRRVGAAALTLGIAAMSGVAAAQDAAFDYTAAGNEMKTKALAAIVALGSIAYLVNALLFAYRKGGKVINKS